MVKFYNKSPFDFFQMSYDRLQSKQIGVVQLLELSFKELLKSLHRKISQRSVKQAGKITVRCKLHSLVFYEFFQAVKHYQSEFGRTLSAEKNKKGFVKVYKINFNHKGTFKYHFGRIVQGDLEKYLIKKFTAGSRGCVEISENSPFVLTFNCNRNELVGNCRFNVINRYGNIC